MRHALVLIDIQNEYFPGGAMELAGAAAAAESAAGLLASFRTAGLPVIHVRHEAAEAGAPFFRAGTPGARIRAGVAPAAGEPLVLKHFPNAFRETNFLELLREREIGRITFCGMMTHMCVDATVRAAFDLGFECRLAADACATCDLRYGGRTTSAADVQTAFLAALGMAFAHVASAAELCADL